MRRWNLIRETMAGTAIRQKESRGREKHAGKPHGERWWDLRIPQIGTFFRPFAGETDECGETQQAAGSP